MDEPPLTDRELRVLRGMIDEYVFTEQEHRHERERRAAWSSRWNRWGIYAATLVAVVTVAGTLINVVLNLSQH